MTRQGWMVMAGFTAFALALPGERPTGRGDLSPQWFPAARHQHLQTADGIGRPCARLASGRPFPRWDGTWGWAHGTPSAPAPDGRNCCIQAEGVNTNTILTQVSRKIFSRFCIGSRPRGLPLGERVLQDPIPSASQLMFPTARCCSLCAYRFVPGNQLDALRVRQPVSC